ncbi:MAG: flagellar hook-associated protein FlgK, partial [Desulfohalobiaceae bacterium]|nr:flagellar hook-associated protein FlgK [Desulfohalobiaceae bacterium]
MPGLLDSLNIARTGMAVNRKAMEVTGNNIANVNTPGYSEQTAEAKSVPGVESSGLTFGQGVNVEEISRAEDIFIQDQLKGAEEKTGRANAKSAPLAELEQVFSVEGDNLATKMEEFFASWKDLAQNPGGEVERSQVIQRGKNLVSAFKEVDRKLDTVKSNINTSLQSEVKTINSKLGEVADLNTKIANAEATGRNAHTAKDEREMLLRDLSEKAGVNTYKGKNDMVSVALAGGQVLVQGQEANQLEFDSDKKNFFLETGNSEKELGRSDFGGALKGLLRVREDMVSKVREQVKTLRHDLVLEINAQHQKGYGLDQDGNGMDDETGRPFFTKGRFVVNDTSLDSPETIVDTDLNNSPNPNISIEVGGSSSQTVTFKSEDDQNGDGQLNLQEMRDGINEKQDLVQASIWNDGTGNYKLSLTSRDRDQGVSSVNTFNFSNSDIKFDPPTAHSGSDQMEVALNDTSHVAAGFSSAPGDNRNAQEMADLVNQKTVKGKFSFVDYYGKIAGEVGIEVNQNQMDKESSQDTLTQLQNRREAKVGVSLKESMLDLTRYQKGFQAAAQYMSKV